MKWIIECQQFHFTFLIEESTRATLANLLTHKETPILVKEDVVQKKEVKTLAISDASLLYFDGSYERSHDAALGGIVIYIAQGKLVRKQGLKLDAKVTMKQSTWLLKVVCTSICSWGLDAYRSKEIPC
ncbi:hypothetical protein [Enterobacter cloacae complex sp. GF14B]|uniref:hypothetical protein n=1 Tax=Enterobacter cloacae complex sp. GF14B TaxID=2511982 RepID=UPI00100F5280|nr:hypothetical protein [Enterobacter cloacae complex sp. GF14B]